MPDLTGRVALVTGGTRGIGLATVRALAEAGATVVLTGRDGARAEGIAATAVPRPGSRWTSPTPRRSSSLVRGVAKEHGKLDIVVANAGIMEDALLGMIREELVDTTLSTNVAGTLHTVQAAARAMMRKKTGSIVVLASIVGEYGSAGQTVYAASKAAVANIARSAAKELGRSGIRVNAVAPGVIETDLTAGLSEDAKAENAGKTPLGAARPGGRRGERDPVPGE